MIGGTNASNYKSDVITNHQEPIPKLLKPLIVRGDYKSSLD